ncbi:MAG TPA: hypothetical protein PLA88_08490, partial [Bacteroidales bacterium]|nr:hypothetical protein [Bacteroidales bacterium]
KAEILFSEAGNDPLKRASVRKDIVQSISQIPNSFARQELVDRCSTILSVETKDLVGELNFILINKERSVNKQLLNNLEIEEEPVEKQQPVMGTDRQEESEKSILRMILLFGDKIIRFQVKDPELKITEIVQKTVAQYIFEELEADSMKLTIPKFGRIYD